jgi:hypothetical protein
VPGDDRERRATAWVLVAQAGAVAAWWLALRSGSVRARFELRPDDPLVLDGFALPDFVVLVVGSAVAAWGVARRAAWAGAVVAIVAGGATYATLHVVHHTVVAGRGGWAVVAMVPLALVDLGLAWRWRPRAAAAAP